MFKLVSKYTPSGDHVAQVRNTNSIVANRLFYKGLRRFENLKNYKNNKNSKMFAIYLRNPKNHTNKSYNFL